MKKTLLKLSIVLVAFSLIACGGDDEISASPTIFSCDRVGTIVPICQEYLVNSESTGEQLQISCESGPVVGEWEESECDDTNSLGFCESGLDSDLQTIYYDLGFSGGNQEADDDCDNAYQGSYTEL